MASNVPISIRIIISSALLSFITLFFKPNLHVPISHLFLTFITLNLGAWVTWIIYLYPNYFSPLRRLPQPKGGYPFIGHGYKLFSRPRGNYLLEFIKDVPNDGIVYFRSFFNSEKLFVTDPQALAEVFVTKSYDFKKSPEASKFLRPFLGDGLILVEGEEHKFQRKHIMPAFSFRHIKELYPIFWKKSCDFLQAIEDTLTHTLETGMEPEQIGVMELNHMAAKVTMDIIGVAGLGYELNALKNSESELIKNYEELLKPTREKLIYFALHIVLGKQIASMLPLPLHKRVQVITGNIRRVCRQIIEEKKSSLKEDSESALDILSLLIRSNSFSDEMLIDQWLTFLAAGHETTASALTWIGYALARYPKVQSHLREEIRSSIQSPKLPVDPSVDMSPLLESLPLLNAVCNETLRLYPTVPELARYTARPTTIQSVYIPEGIAGLDAGEFNPNRWIDSETGRANNHGGAKSNYSFMTFLHGPRSCIGDKFAKAELRILVAHFCGRYEMSLARPNEEVIPSGVITIKPGNGMYLKLKAVEGW